MPRPSTAVARPGFEDLEQAASCVIRLMRDAPALANTRLALIGDLAVTKYLQQPASCESIEFIVSKPTSPSLVKKTLLAQSKKLLVERPQGVYFKHPAGWAVEIKITPEWLCPYLPSSARPIVEIKELPYISLTDLFVFKADACGLRESEAGRQKEAYHAGALLELASTHFPLELEDYKLQKVEEALDTLLDYAPQDHDKSWWLRRLGKQCDRRRSTIDILSELSEGLRIDDEENRRTRRRPSVFSLSNRGSETSISSASSMSSQNTTPVASPSGKMRPRKMSVSGTYPRPRRHTQTTLDTPPDEEPMSPLYPMSHDINRLHAELMHSRGRNSPGIGLMARP
ncbi:hypothetical protein F5Y18DRAFT_255723 [Xylariaceae sp. FL1019]|nr:hypothetical protein F5Y18DRAFT_255723 [Xylariaceae sp. FL1019]